MKKFREHVVPLSDRALAILKQQQDLYGGRGLVFRGRRTSTGNHLSGEGLTRILRKNEVPTTIHGMRSSFRDWASEKTMTEHEVVEMALAHVVGDATVNAYRRTTQLEKRRVLMDKWAGYVWSKAAKVVNLRGGVE